MAAPRDNQNARKETPATEILKVRLTPEAKRQYQQKADAEGLTLSKWVLSTLDRECEK